VGNTGNFRLQEVACVDCGALILVKNTSKIRCDACRATEQARRTLARYHRNKETLIPQRKARREEKIANGMCEKCSSPAVPHKTLCERCQKRSYKLWHIAEKKRRAAELEAEEAPLRVWRERTKPKVITEFDVRWNAIFHKDPYDVR
jgi:DNA-directed RNA polymerase subunit M/transcription elongation factor TFIIS